jgi:hypothetical protein
MLELLSITRDPDYARLLWGHEGSTVFVDLEMEGKAERQSGRDTVISGHTLEDAERLLALPDRGPVLVRTNPWGARSRAEVARLVPRGVDRLMLPMFRSADEVLGIAGAVDEAERGEGRDGEVRVSLLSETHASVVGIEAILALAPDRVDHVHLGLNDLALERGAPFLFEPVGTGEVADVARRVQRLGRRFGFGGVGLPSTLPGQGGADDGADAPPVPPERILGEHVRVGSSMVILSRAFHRAVEEAEDRAEAVADGIARVRAWEDNWRKAGAEALEENHHRLREAIEGVVIRMEGKA